jgi:hypothetical protein
MQMRHHKHDHVNYNRIERGNNMADEQPSLHIDTDWKKQAQEEKRKLAEQEKQRATSSAPPPPMPGQAASAAASEPPSTEPRRAAAGSRAGRGAASDREMPPASLASLVQSIVTQVLFYLGDLAPRGGEPMLNLDMAKHQIDMLGILDEKTKGNLTDDERRMLDAALYETRMRYVAMASQLVS